MADQYDRIDQWLDWGDHTVTIDPIGNKPWIHEGDDGKHQAAAERGRAYDAADVKHLAELLSKATTPQTSFYLPNWEDLERVPKFPSRRNGDCDVWRGKLRDVRGAGELPVINKQVYYNTLPDVDKGTIERQVYNGRHIITQKALSKSGVPDYGRPSYSYQQDF